jgi:hypothetical protein
VFFRPKKTITLLFAYMKKLQDNPVRLADYLTVFLLSCKVNSMKQTNGIGMDSEFFYFLSPNFFSELILRDYQ